MLPHIFFDTGVHPGDSSVAPVGTSRQAPVASGTRPKLGLRRQREWASALRARLPWLSNTRVARLPWLSSTHVALIPQPDRMTSRGDLPRNSLARFAPEIEIVKSYCFSKRPVITQLGGSDGEKGFRLRRPCDALASAHERWRRIYEKFGSKKFSKICHPTRQAYSVNSCVRFWGR